MFPLILFLAALAVFLPGNAYIPITDPVESNYALTAKEMLLSGDLLSPRIYGHYWYDKPAMIYWLIAAGYKLFGIGEFAARLPAAVFSAASVAFAGWAAVRLWGDRLTGLFTAVVLATSLEYWVLARMVITDAVLFFFNSVALFSLYLGLGGAGRGWYYAAYAAAGLAVLTKGPVGLLLPMLIIFVHILVSRRLELLGRLYILPGAVVFLLVAAPWYLAMYQVHGQTFVDTFLGLHNYLRATVSEHPKDNVFYYYLVLFPVSLLPWTGVFLRSLALKRTPHFTFLAVWLVVTIGFYSLMATKYPTYVFPALFPAALLTGRALGELGKARSRSLLWLTLPAALLLAVYAFGVRLLPAAEPLYIYLILAAGALIIILLQIRGQATLLPLAVGLVMAAVSLTLITQGLIPLAQDRSAKAVAVALPPSGAEVAAIDTYATSAVFYSGYTIPKLVAEGTPPSAGVWAGKYTMPTESVASFAARTAGRTDAYIIGDADGTKVPGFRKVGDYGRYTLYKRE
jgi:4-amino-4-deoxy-L-arabinose transferase-like glycosyltransferase